MLKVDRSRLFVDGVYIGIKNNRYNGVIYYPYSTYDNSLEWLDEYNNECLSYNGRPDCKTYVQRIICLDNDGAITALLFDRERDMVEATNGQFVKVCHNILSKQWTTSVLGVVVDERIVYEDGEWDCLGDVTPYLIGIYDTGGGFDCGRNPSENDIVWEHPEYTKWKNELNQNLPS